MGKRCSVEPHNHNKDRLLWEGKMTNTTALDRAYSLYTSYGFEGNLKQIWQEQNQ